jgi:hypothetical protein
LDIERLRLGTGKANNDFALFVLNRLDGYPPHKANAPNAVANKHLTRKIFLSHEHKNTPKPV